MRSIYRNHPVHGKCLFIDNGTLEVGIALEFGIRIVHFSFLGGENVFYVQPTDSHAFQTPEGWRLRGGHRMWITPENAETYYPDNAPVEHEIRKNGVVVTQKPDPLLKIVKSMEISFTDGGVEVKHIITNTARGTRRAAIWPISVMAPGGIETVPLPTEQHGAEIMYKISMWHHSSLSDERLSFKKDKIVLEWRDIDLPLKIGVGHPSDCVSYARGENTFFVNYNVQSSAEYPDGGVSYETFLSKYMVEVESLSPVYTLRRGESAEHTEIWKLKRNRKYED